MVDMTSLASAFAGRKVLVTGHTGFKGSWLALWLKQLGADVMGYALPPQESNSHFSQLGLDRAIRHEVGDIRDYEHVLKCFTDFQPEVVFHLAAQPLVRYSYREPKETFDVNVAGSVNLLEACRNIDSIRALVYVTSDKCYRNNEWIWGYRENDELGGHDPYSASKAAAELVFSSYVDSFFKFRPHFGAASVRAGNVIGGGDWAEDRIVPDCIRALTTGQPIQVRNPHSTRPWQHVLDPLSGYLSVAAQLLSDPANFSGAWNFGPNTSSVKTVGELAKLIIGTWGSGEIEIAPQVNTVHEARLLHLNCDKAHQLLNWQPRWDAETAITKTVEWYRATASKADAMKISSAQIEKYMEAR
ncbi:CDP-glucose 4,6-dehydratase [Herbaspirillum sp. NPDC101397]|uniref:CDP-glucose 4,6-dehydratase n=1 Tax=Herbaspirillum sp. NPDC101397 TaxID=3364006 RepID=UPI00383A09F5